MILFISILFFVIGAIAYISAIITLNDVESLLDELDKNPKK